MAFTYKGYRLYVKLNKTRKDIEARFFFRPVPPLGEGIAPSEIPRAHVVIIDDRGRPSLVNMDQRCPNCGSYNIVEKRIKNLFRTKVKGKFICGNCGNKVGEGPFVDRKLYSG